MSVAESAKKVFDQGLRSRLERDHKLIFSSMRC